jgi:hypothetical protein
MEGNKKEKLDFILPLGLREGVRRTDGLNKLILIINNNFMETNTLKKAVA